MNTKDMQDHLTSTMDWMMQEDLEILKAEPSYHQLMTSIQRPEQYTLW